MGKLRSTITKTGKIGAKAYKKSLKKPDRKTYTEKEKKELSSLRGKKYRLDKKIKDLNKTATNETVTFKDLRPFMDDDGSDSLAAELAQNGYFQEPDYSTRDFREWMRSEEGEDAEDYIRDVIDRTNSLRDDPDSRLDPDSGLTESQRKLMKQYEHERGIIEGKINAIQNKANKRKAEKDLKYLNKKTLAETGYNIFEAIDEGIVAEKKLSNIEKAGIDQVKKDIVGAVFKHINFDDFKDEYQGVVKSVVYNSVMNGAISGLPAGVIGTLAAEATVKYGNAAGELAGGMAQSMVGVLKGGSPSFTGIGGALFNFAVNKSKYNKEQMLEQADFIASSPDVEAYNKQNGDILKRDIVVDIAKNVIMTGGNIFAALPGIFKDVVIDTAQAGLRDVTFASKHGASSSTDLKKQQEAAKKAQEEYRAQQKPVYDDELIMKFMGDLTVEQIEEVKKELKQK